MSRTRSRWLACAACVCCRAVSPRRCRSVSRRRWTCSNTAWPHFETQQHEMLEVHEQYLNNQTEYFRLFYQLTQQQQALIASQTLTPGAVENLTRSLAVCCTIIRPKPCASMNNICTNSPRGFKHFCSLIREQYLNLAAARSLPVMTQRRQYPRQCAAAKPAPSSDACPTRTCHQCGRLLRPAAPQLSRLPSPLRRSPPVATPMTAAAQP